MSETPEQARRRDAAENEGPNCKRALDPGDLRRSNGALYVIDPRRVPKAVRSMATAAISPCGPGRDPGGCHRCKTTGECPPLADATTRGSMKTLWAVLLADDLRIERIVLGPMQVAAARAEQVRASLLHAAQRHAPDALVEVVESDVDPRQLPLFRSTDEVAPRRVNARGHGRT